MLASAQAATAFALECQLCCWYNRTVVTATGKSSDMVPLHILVPREMKERLDSIARQDRRTLAITVRMMVEKGIAERAGEAENGAKR